MKRPSEFLPRLLPLVVLFAAFLGWQGPALAQDKPITDTILDMLFPDGFPDDLLELDKEERRLMKEAASQGDLAGNWTSRYNWNGQGWKPSSTVCITQQRDVVIGEWYRGDLTGVLSGGQLAYTFNGANCSGSGLFKFQADGRMNGKYYCEGASGEWELTKRDDKACTEKSYRPRGHADAWLGKWSSAASYGETSDVFKWWFRVTRKCNEYQVGTHTSGPEKVEILNITARDLEFLFHDDLGTHITISRQDSESFSGTVSQPNNAGLPFGRVDGQRLELNYQTDVTACPPETLAEGEKTQGKQDKEADPYADKVASWRRGNPAWREGSSSPDFALGAPDYKGSHLDESIATLGCGGQIALEFTDNVLGDGEGKDLRIFEPGDKETYQVEISTDGAEWRGLGRFEGDASIDIGPVAEPTDRFRFVRITDTGEVCNGVRPGADVDAVEALQSAGVALAADTGGPDLLAVEIVSAVSDEPIETLEVGESFRIRLTLTEDPDESVSRSVTVRTSNGIETQIEVEGEDKVFFSGPIQVTPLVEP